MTETLGLILSASGLVALIDNITSSDSIWLTMLFGGMFFSGLGMAISAIVESAKEELQKQIDRLQNKWKIQFQKRLEINLLFFNT